MKLRISLAAALFTLSTPVFAFDVDGGTTVGNGGHGVSCSDDTVTLLDTAEAKAQFHFTPMLDVDQQMLILRFGDKSYDYPPLGQLYAAYLSNALNRASEVLPPDHPFINLFIDLIADISTSGSNFADAFLIKNSDSLSETTDTGPLFVTPPQNCVLVQLAKSSSGTEGFLLEVNAKFWEKLSLIDQTALIMHEGFHIWFGQQDNTLAARQAVWYLTAPKQFRAKNKNAFINLINKKRPQTFSAEK